MHIMKTPIPVSGMTSAEKSEYIANQKKMIHVLQLEARKVDDLRLQLTKSLESVATHRAALRGLWETPESESVRNHVKELLK